MSNTKLLAIGGAYIDINCDYFPFGEQGILPESEVVGGKYEIVPGGSAVNFARLCSSLQIPTTFVGKTGDDVMGAALTKLLQESGVQPELIVDKSADTNISFNITNEAGKTIMTVVGSANQSLTPDEVYDRASAVIGACSHLYLGGCFKLKSLLPALEELAARAKEAGTKIVLDHGRVTNGITEDEKNIVRRLAQQSDYYLPSRDEFQDLWDLSSAEEGLRLLASKTTAKVVVKDGKNGALTLIDGELVRVPAFPVEHIHTIGAGDSFTAGFISAQSRGDDLRASMRFGCATAALKISQRDLPTSQAVEKFLADESS